MSGSTTRLSKTTLYRLVSSTVCKVLVLVSRLILCGLWTRISLGSSSGSGDFVNDVLFEEVEIQLFLSTCVEGEPAYLAFDFSIFGFVPIILGTRSSKLDDMISCFEFTGEFSEMISQGWNGLTGPMGEDDGVRVEV